MPNVKVLKLRFPLLGVGREADFASPSASGPRPKTYSTPWAVNVRPRDPFEGRLRGGSRLGLTELGTPITLRPPFTTAVGNLLTEAGDKLLTEADEEILVDTGTMPSGYFLMVRQGSIYALDSGAVTIQNVTTGVIRTLQASAGSLPSSCTVGCVYRDRLILAGADNIVHASRLGDFTDWDYGANVENPGRAIPFQLSEAGQIGETVTALAPHKDNFLLAGTARDLWLWRGDPATGGLVQISRHVGILSERAWAKVDDTIVFLAHDGLHSVDASGANLQNLSEDSIPAELVDIDPAATTILVGYCHSERGVYIFLDSEDYDWFFDLETRRFWPTVFGTDQRPVELLEADGELVMVATDGTKLVVGGDDDDGDAIESHLLIGPFAPADGVAYGQVLNLHGTLSAGSDDVTWRLVTGDSAEGAAADAKTAIGLYLAGDTSGAEAYAKDSGTLTAGRLHLTYPRVRAPWVVLWLQSVGKWAYEGVTLETGLPGRWR